jgi:hypothetical protein
MNRNIKVFSITGAILFGIYLGAIIYLSNESTSTPIITRPTLQKSHTWTKQDSLAYAHDQVIKNAEAQFTCLADLWGKESSWNPKAFNPIKVMGKNAGGIGQLLGMSPLTPPTIQIDRGLAYIYWRYGTDCFAWKHFLRYSWY